MMDTGTIDTDEIVSAAAYGNEMAIFFGCDAYFSIDPDWATSETQELPYPIAINVIWPATLPKRIDEAHLLYDPTLNKKCGDKECTGSSCFLCQFDDGAMIFLCNGKLVYTLHCPNVFRPALGNFPTIHVDEQGSDATREYDVPIFHAHTAYNELQKDLVAIQGKLAERWPVMEWHTAGFFPPTENEQDL
jgi:hypothetical protein